MERKHFEFRLEDIESCTTTNSVDVRLNKGLDKVVLGLGLTDRCNINCPKCYYRENLYKVHDKKEMSYDFLESVLEDIGTLEQIIIGLEGEPLCHSKIIDILELCRQHSKSITLVSNGLLIKDLHLKKFEEINLNSLVLSCDGFSDKSYNFFHKGGRFATFINQAEKAVHSLGNRVSIHSVITNLNLREIELLPIFASQLGINRITVSQLRENQWSKFNGLKRCDKNDLIEKLPILIDTASKLDVSLIFDALFASGELLKWMNKYLNNHAQELKKLSSTHLPNHL